MAKVPANRPKRRPHPPGTKPTQRSAPTTPGLIEAVIPSDFAHSRELQHRILDEVAAHGYAEQSVFGIRIALEEALVNAIRHGNAMNPAKKVRVWYRVTPRQVDLYVEDEGPGFRRCNVPDPTCDENLEKCSGRGILLMEAYMTKVSFERGGRRLHLMKRR